MSRKGVVVSNAGISEQICSVLTNKWQTSSMIASQIVFAPDAIARTRGNYLNGAYGNRSPSVLSDAGIKSGLVARSMSSLYRAGRVEKRKIDGRKAEYRIAQPKQESSQ